MIVRSLVLNLSQLRKLHALIHTLVRHMYVRTVSELRLSQAETTEHLLVHRLHMEGSQFPLTII